MGVGTRKQNGRANRGGAQQRMPVKPGSRGRTANSRPAWRTEQDHNKVRQRYKEEKKRDLSQALLLCAVVLNSAYDSDKLPTKSCQEHSSHSFPQSCSDNPDSAPRGPSEPPFPQKPWKKALVSISLQPSPCSLLLV